MGDEGEGDEGDLRRRIGIEVGVGGGARVGMGGGGIVVVVVVVVVWWGFGGNRVVKILFFFFGKSHSPKFTRSDALH